MRLSELEVGKSGIITVVGCNRSNDNTYSKGFGRSNRHRNRHGSEKTDEAGITDAALRHHLLDMGLTPGTKVTVRKIAPLGDPMELTLRGYELTLRKEDAEKIQLDSQPDAYMCSTCSSSGCPYRCKGTGKNTGEKEQQA